MVDAFTTGPDVRLVLVADLQLDPAAQPRAALDPDAVAEYREAARAGAKFTPPVVAFDDGEKLWVGDGFHRILAHITAGLKTIEADVRPGTRRDAVLHSCGANAAHGLKRSPGDKRRAVETLLTDPEWSGYSDIEIARLARVSPTFVAALRQEGQPAVDSKRLESDSGPDCGFDSQRLESTPPERPRRGADGRVINTANIGRKPARRPAPGAYEDDTPAYEDESQEPPGATPAGQSRINGVLTGDPPDVAAARAAGRLEPGVVPDVTEPAPAESADREPGGDDDREVPEADLSDGDWLATLPLSSVLTDGPLRVFHADALTYRRLEPHRKTFAYHAARSIPVAARKGAFVWHVKRFLMVNHPQRWLACPAETEGGCGGIGVGPFGDCPKCHGRGYWILGG